MFRLGATPAPMIKSRDVAVIDVGSNSVRLVQFRVEGRTFWPVFNEKTMAGLGRSAAQTGRLDPEGVRLALRTLRRFGRMLDARGVAERLVVATAAVRECEDGPLFVDRVRRETGLPITILSGDDEGRYSSLGVLVGVGEAHGVCGDLGGSSLELGRLSRREVEAVISLPLGPLALNAAECPPETLRNEVRRQLKTAAPVLTAAGDTFYAVGGAWRAFANLSMAMRKYPLNLLHGYRLDREEVGTTAHFVIDQSQFSFASFQGVASRRAANLPYASMLLDEILHAGGFRQVMFSAYGLREGVLCVSDPDLIGEDDPLLNSVEAMARIASFEPEFGTTLADWLEGVLSDEAPAFGLNRDQRLRAAAARLSDIGARLHPDHRADLAFTQVLYAPIGGHTHAERAFLALTIHHRYNGKGVRPDTCPAVRLLDERQREAALRLGLGLRFGAALSGCTASLLNQFRLSRNRDSLTILAQPGAEELIMERTWRRFEQFASAMDLIPLQR